MTSFETITPEEYKKLVDNEKRIFNLTKNFTTPEILNKYRHTDKNIDNRIKQEEMVREKNENLDRIINKNIDKIIEKKTEITTNVYDNEYNFDNDVNILNSFSKAFKEYEIEYVPRINTKLFRVRYLLRKLKESDNIPKNLYNHFYTGLLENNKLYHIIPVDKVEEEQTGSSINNTIINNKDLDNGILRVRYLNNRKLTNNLLKHDNKISKNMINAIKYNKDIHKLSENEMKIYHESQNFLNKEQDINVLIGSYLSGNNSKKLYNKISSMLYYELKNGIISKKEYANLINRINKE